MRGVLLFSSTLALALPGLAVPPQKFWSISSYYPDLLCCLHVQIRLMGNFGLNTSIPWATQPLIAPFASSAEKVKRLRSIFFSIARVLGAF